MIKHLNDRTGLMKDNGLALRVLEELQAVAHLVVPICVAP